MVDETTAIEKKTHTQDRKEVKGAHTHTDTHISTFFVTHFYFDNP